MKIFRIWKEVKWKSFKNFEPIFHFLYGLKENLFLLTWKHILLDWTDSSRILRFYHPVWPHNRDTFADGQKKLECPYKLFHNENIKILSPIFNNKDSYSRCKRKLESWTQSNFPGVFPQILLSTWAILANKRPLPHIQSFDFLLLLFSSYAQLLFLIFLPPFRCSRKRSFLFIFLPIERFVIFIAILLIPAFFFLFWWLLGFLIFFFLLLFFFSFRW